MINQIFYASVTSFKFLNFKKYEIILRTYLSDQVFRRRLVFGFIFWTVCHDNQKTCEQLRNIFRSVQQKQIRSWTYFSNHHNCYYFSKPFSSKLDGVLFTEERSRPAKQRAIHLIYRVLPITVLNKCEHGVGMPDSHM